MTSDSTGSGPFESAPGRPGTDKEQEMESTTQRLARFETAKELLRMMVALRSEKIGIEQKKPVPDLRMIEQWNRERSAFMDEEEALSYRDSQAQDRVIATYGPIVRAGFAAR